MSQLPLKIGGRHDAAPEVGPYIEGVDISQTRKDERRETSLGLVAIVALTQMCKVYLLLQQ